MKHELMCPADVNRLTAFKLTILSSVYTILYPRWRWAEQGFVDQFGVFLTREAAHAITWARGQIRRRCGGDAKTLYSENLY